MLEPLKFVENDKIQFQRLETNSREHSAQLTNPPRAFFRSDFARLGVQPPLAKGAQYRLCLEMSGPIDRHKRDPEDARIAIDSYLQAIHSWSTTTSRAETRVPSAMEGRP
jgi:hypothetical protein